MNSHGVPEEATRSRLSFRPSSPAGLTGAEALPPVTTHMGVTGLPSRRAQHPKGLRSAPSYSGSCFLVSCSVLGPSVPTESDAGHASATHSFPTWPRGSAQLTLRPGPPLAALEGLGGPREQTRDMPCAGCGLGRPRRPPAASGSAQAGSEPKETAAMAQPEPAGRQRWSEGTPPGSLHRGRAEPSPGEKRPELPGETDGIRPGGRGAGRVGALQRSRCSGGPECARVPLVTGGPPTQWCHRSFSPHVPSS